MKKAETLIVQIKKLDDEIHNNYSYEEIMKAIEKCEEEGKIPLCCTDFIHVLYEECLNETGYWMKEN